MTGRALCIALALIAGASQGAAPVRSLTYCLDDASEFEVPEDSGMHYIHGPWDLGLEIRPNARFTIQRNEINVLNFSVPDLINPNGQVIWAPDGEALALNYSDGGGLGGWHVRVFTVNGSVATDASTVIAPAVRDFKSRHSCRTRGNNVMALKWVKDSRHLLLTTEVYPTGDCGRDLGHTEGYLVSVPSGRIERQLAERELENFPGVCLQNADQ